MRERNPEIRRPEPELPLFARPEGAATGDKAVAGVVSQRAERNSRSELRQDAPALCPRFEQAHARHSDPENSHKAAASVSLENLGPTKEGIRKVLRLYGSSTDERIAFLYRGLRNRGEDLPESSPSGLRSRRAWLVDHGFVCEVSTGKTQAGRNCSIWGIAERNAGESK